MHERRVERTEVTEPTGEVVDRSGARVVETPAGEVVTPTTHRAAVGTPGAAAVDEVHATAYDPYAGRRRSSYRLVQAIWLLFGIIEGLLAIRFVLRLLGANESAGFASFIYSASAPFLAPFVGLFGNPGAGGSVLELNTLVAMVVYLLLAWLVAKVVWLLAGESRSATRTVASSTRARLE